MKNLSKPIGINQSKMKILLKMKLTFLFLITGLIAVSASTYSQNTLLDINVKDNSIVSLFDEIERQSEFYFFYQKEELANLENVSIDIKGAKVTEILDEALQETDLEYKIVDRYIIIRKDGKGLDDVESLLAQQKTVMGSVKDENGLALPGVTVVIKGTSQGTVTDLDGNFSISNIPENGVLVFSFIGMRSQEIPVGSQTSINVTMETDAIGLDEVVAIGYGSVKKSDLTGSVISVGSDKLDGRPYSNALQSMSGQVSGVQIVQTQGAPGLAPTVKIRGASSINSGTTPLYVIDGIPIEDNTEHSTSTKVASGSNLNFNRNPMNYINPNDIESVQILKDASSAAIYGSRGANGVVIITTKSGKAGKTKVEANYEFGVSHLTRPLELMNAPEWMEFQTYARNNSWATIVANDPNATRELKYTVPPEFTDPEWIARIGEGTDWQDVAFRTALSHNLQISASGGSENTQFMVSAGYLDSEGIMDQNTYDRINLRSNMKHQFSDRARMALNIGLSRAKETPYGTSGKSGETGLTVQSDPIFPLRVETGTLGFKDPSSIWNTFVKYGFQLWHPWSMTREIEYEKIMTSITANAYLEYDILDNLTFKTGFSSNIEDIVFTKYLNEGQDWGYSGYIDANADFNTLKSVNWVWENTLNYNKTFNDVHDLNVIAGYTVQEQRIDQSSMHAIGFPNDLVHTLNAGVVSDGSTSAEDWSLISYLARANYSLMDKYLLTATIRADGSSRFGANNRWGYFPSVSAAWRASEESFLQDVTWLDNLKVRLSYGTTGNNQITNYGAIGALGYAPYVNGGNVETGISTNSFADKDLKWEKTGQTNFGVDMTIFDQRVNLSLDAYYSKTRDLLLSVPIPIITGFSSTLTNIGELENRGIEFNISTRNIDNEFKWITDFNIFANRNKVLKLGENDAPIDYSVSSMISRTAVGQPIGMFFGYIFDGVIMSQAELNSLGTAVWSGSEPGDPKVRDVNGDGIISSDDRTYIGNNQADFSWGLTNTFAYSGVELSVMLRGSHGGEIVNHIGRYLKSHGGGGNRNQFAIVNNFWRSESDPGDGQIFKPRSAQIGAQGQGSSYWVEDASFVRIQNIRLGYNLPSNLVQKAKVSGIKLYVNLENVYLFSDYAGFDPEGSTYQTGVMVGFDYAAYPNPMTATAGVNITF